MKKAKQKKFISSKIRKALMNELNDSIDDLLIGIKKKKAAKSNLPVSLFTK